MMITHEVVAYNGFGCDRDGFESVNTDWSRLGTSFPGDEIDGADVLVAPEVAEPVTFYFPGPAT